MLIVLQVAEIYFQQLKYHTVVDVRSSRGKNARGHKVTGLAVHGDKLLVRSVHSVQTCFIQLVFIDVVGDL